MSTSSPPVAPALALLLAWPLLLGARTLAQSETALADQVEALYGVSSGGPRAPGTTGSSGDLSPCALMREIDERWDSLSPEVQERLKPLVSPPDEVEAGNGPAAPSSTQMPGYLTATTQHFEIRYWTETVHAVVPGDANKNGIPDYVDGAAAYLERAYAKQVNEMGFKAPPAPLPVVWFRALQFNGLTHFRGGRASWIEINSNILGYTKQVLGSGFRAERVSRDPAGAQAGLLKAVCAHEFFHAVQFQYRQGAAPWWAEGSADWMGHNVFPESGFYLNNIGPHLDRPDVSLFAKGNFYDYSSSIFPLFLSEQTKARDTTIKNIWAAHASMELYPAMESVMGDLRETFLLFASYNYTKGYQDGARFPDVPRQRVSSYPSSQSPTGGREPEYFGASYFEYTSQSPGKLTLRVTPEGGFQVGAKLITVDAGDGHWDIHKLKGAVGGEQTVTVAGLGSSYSRVTLVVGNFTPDQKARFTVEASLDPE